MLVKGLYANDPVCENETNGDNDGEKKDSFFKKALDKVQKLRSINVENKVDLDSVVRAETENLLLIKTKTNIKKAIELCKHKFIPNVRLTQSDFG
jgi:hypothetical protein